MFAHTMFAYLHDQKVWLHTDSAIREDTYTLLPHFVHLVVRSQLPGHQSTTCNYFSKAIKIIKHAFNVKPKNTQFISKLIYQD